MRTKPTFIGGLVAVAVLALAVGLTQAQGPTPSQPSPWQGEGNVNPQAALGTTFTYQGQLKKGGNPVNDTCSIAFRLYDQAGTGSPPTGGNLIGGPITTTVLITNGLFTVQLDFGAGAFQGDARWLEIAVKCTGDADYAPLSPRQKLTPAPYALALPGLWTQQNDTSPNLIGGYSGNSVASGVVGATIGGGGYSGVINRVTANYGTVSGGSGNTAGDTGATVGGGSNNTASGQYATVPGGNQNAAVGNYSFAAGRRAKANHTGAFVWADSMDADFSSTAADQFAVRATGGVTFTTGSAGFLVNGNTVWHAGNDGHNSGLDADTLDGQHASAFASAALLGSSYVYEGSSTQDQLFGMSTTGWAVLTDGDGDWDHTLVITTTNVRVEYTLWYGSTVVHGEASQGSPATITFPHYLGFQLILARHQYIASLVCNENDGIVACVYQKSHP